MELFEIILSPFLFIIKQLFLFSYRITGNYGVSIVLLSFCISLLLLPIFILIEKAKKKDDVKKLKMKPFVDEIKRCYKGQERYYYLKTLNRQHGYSPIRALIPILSLLLQIPFFIAAYQFLEGYEQLKGDSFLFIKDLSLPDALIGAINILPIVMTLVNLLTAYFYTRNGNTSERRQMVIVAGVFLLLLYRLPAGLLLYWTMNNVFSFFRLFITNPEVFGRYQGQQNEPTFSVTELKLRLKPLLPKLKTTFFIILFIGVLSQINWALNNHFDDIFYRFAAALLGSVAVVIFLGLFLIFHKVTLSGKENSFKSYFLQLWPVFRPSFVVLTSIVVVFQINWAIQYNFNDFGIRLIMAFILGAVGTTLLALLSISYQSANIKLNWSLLTLNKRYIYIYSILYFGFIVSQVSWALKFNFNDFVIRLLVGGISIWALILLAAHLIKFIENDKRFSYKECKMHLRNVLPLLKFVLVPVIIVVFISQFYWTEDGSSNSFGFQLFISILLGSLVTCVYLFFTAIINMYLSIFREIKTNQWLFYSSLFLSAYFYFASKFYYSRSNFDLAVLSMVFLFLGQVIGLINFRIQQNKLNVVVKKTTNILLSVSSLMQLGTMIVYLIIENSSNMFLLPNSIINLGTFNELVLFGSVFIILTIPYSIKRKTQDIVIGKKSGWSIYLLSVFYLVGFVFLWNPLSIYSSFPSNFEFPAVEILSHNFNLFAFSILVSLGLYLLIPKKYKYIWLTIIFVLVCLSFVHNTLLTIDVGSLQDNKFVKQDKLAQPIIYYVLEGVGILTGFYGILWLLVKKYFKPIWLTLLLLNTVLISQALFDAIGTKSFFEKPAISADIPNSISFSKEKENIVFMIVDMFHGWYIDRMTKENPEIRKSLEGFTWYPNTLSVSSITGSSIGPILGGDRYTVDKLNENKNQNLEEKITGITEELYDKVKSKGYSFTATPMIYSKIDKSKFDTYLPKWHDSWNQWNAQLQIGVSKEVGYTLLWENALFYSAPLFLKSTVYNDGKWMQGDVETNENTSHTKPYNFLRLLPYISNTQNDRPSFIYLHTYASHHPWDIIDENGKLHADVSPYENNKWTIETIAKWVKWMKDNGVYDNTKIVLLSDHGPHWGHSKGEMDMDIPLIEDENGVASQHTMGQFALLMVKDFGNKSILDTDFRFMSNADASAIAFNENDPCKWPVPYERTLPSTIVEWERKMWLNNQFKIRHQYMVQNNMFDMSNWKEINK